MRNPFLLAALLTVICCSCNVNSGERVKGNGNVKTEERTVSSFNEVRAEGAIDVYVTQGDIIPLVLEADENLISYLETIQEGKKVIIRTRKGFNLRPSGRMKVYVTAPDFEAIDVSGACNIIGQSKLDNDDDLRLNVSGAGDINMEVDAPRIEAKVSGSGSVKLKGETKDFEIRLSGAANAECYDLLSESTVVKISGAGDAEVYASVKLSAEVSGAGTVKYKGNARSVSQQVNGAGSVKKVD